MIRVTASLPGPRIGVLSWTTDPSGYVPTGRVGLSSRPDACLSPLAASGAALLLLALSCEASGMESSGAPVEERALPPLLTPPGAIVEPRDGEGVAPDPLVSDFEGGTAVPSAAPGDASYRQPTFTRTATPRGEMPTDAAGVLFGQLQDLQQEVMALRGVIEAQQRRIGELEREQRERYLDLDRRLALIGSGALPIATTDSAMASGAGPEAASAGATAEGPIDEREAYERAFALTREKRFEEAIPAFRRVIDEYPGGQYVPNAWYWLGELYLALPAPDLERARQAFVQVIQNWPDNRKVPDAKYKLGVVYDRLGEPLEARMYLDRVLTEHAETPAARLAASYLDRLEG